ncbi:MAG: helix-turn-helix domain-containing protein [Christensenellales bacterium]
MTAIKRKRTLMNFSQEDIAKRLNITQGAVSRLVTFLILP